MPHRVRVLTAACFFVSGAAGLIYELVWTRYLNLVFGSTTYSIATVVAIYMFGLGAGSLVFGKLADRSPRPVRTYAWVEVGIAACAVLSPLLYRAIGAAFVGAYHAIAPGPAVGALIKVVLAFLALAPPTLLMGGTLPLLVRSRVASGVEAAREVGHLYAINTLGAVVGAGLGGFVLLERFGLAGSLTLAGGLNLSAGLTALALRVAPLPTAARAAGASPGWGWRLPGVRLAAALALASGFASLVAEVAWTRVLGLTIGSSTYAFTIILVAFLLGIGLGSWIAGRRRAFPEPIRGIVWGQALAGAGGLVVLGGYEAFTRIAVHYQQNTLFEFPELMAVKAIVVLIAVLPATLGMGITFPLIAALAVRESERAGEEVGIVYAANTFGSIAGSLVAGFALLVWIGSQATLRLAVVVHLAVAIAAMLAARPRADARRRWRVPVVVTAAALAVGWLLPRWPPGLQSLGTYVYKRGQIRNRLAVDELFGMGKVHLLFDREGLSSVVSVWDEDGVRSLRVNGKADASSGRDMETQIAIGLKPALAHPRPERALVIGAGSGVTARALAAYPGIRSVDLVEIEPVVIEAGRLFESINGGVYRDPRVHVIPEDGRNHLLITRQVYDVIASEPSNPWMAGTANLFTREFYELVRAHLGMGGVFCQWIQQYDLTTPTLRRLLATVLATFPEVQAWSVGGADLVVLASDQPIVFERARAEAFLHANPVWMQQVKGLLAEDGEDLLVKQVLDRRGMADFSDGAEPFRDDPPQLEFLALRSHGDTRWAPRLVRDLLAARERNPPTPACADAWPGVSDYDTGRLLFAWNDLGRARAALTAAAVAQPGSAKRWRWAGDAEARLRNLDAAISDWSRSVESDPANATARARLAEAALSRRDLDQAAAHLAAIAPADREPHVWLLEAAVAARRGEVETALARLRETVRSLGELAEPASVLDQALVMCDELARAGHASAVIDELSLWSDDLPRVPKIELALAEILESTGDAARALGHYQHVLSAGPAVPALVGWARCLATLGRRDEARAALDVGLDYEPWNLELYRLQRDRAQPLAATR